MSFEPPFCLAIWRMLATQQTFDQQTHGSTTPAHPLDHHYRTCMLSIVLKSNNIWLQFGDLWTVPDQIFRAGQSRSCQLERSQCWLWISRLRCVWSSLSVNEITQRWRMEHTDVKAMNNNNSSNNNSFKTFPCYLFRGIRLAVECLSLQYCYVNVLCNSLRQT